MSYDINLYRAAKSARLAAEQPKYADLCPTEPTPEDDARVRAERNAMLYSGAPALPQVEALGCVRPRTCRSCRSAAIVFRPCRGWSPTTRRWRSAGCLP